jgi:guanylate kinase
MEKTRIIIVGRGGSGKNFLMGRMVERGMVPGILFTSRPPREGEVDGVDYNFRSPDLFEFAHEEFYDLEMYNGWYYGILKKQFKKNDVFIMTPDRKSVV